MTPARLITPIALLAGSACTLGPDFALPGFGGGTQWKETRGTADAPLPDDWWKLFQDPVLNRLVDRAFEANQDLAAARERIRTARALVGVDRARLFPALDLNARGGIDRSSESAISGRLPQGVSIDPEVRNYRGTFDLAYEADLWGRNRRSLEAALASADAAAARADATRLGIAAEVARQYFLLRGLEEQQTVLKETIASRRSTLELLTSKAEAGLADGIATNQASTELELATDDLARVDRQRGAAEHALAVLCGTQPSEFTPGKAGTPKPLPQLRPGLPAEVLARRPDVRAATSDLRAANARIGVAEAAFYPDFRLTAAGGFESLEPGDFLDWQNRVLSLGAGVTAPVFNAGRNRAALDAAISRRDEALANYKNTLLVALREVEDSATDLNGLSRSRKALDQALASATQARDLVAERHDKGLVSYLEVVEADRTVLRIRLTLAQTDAEQRITLAALAKALGGGWGRKS